ncbi:hypothetical protein FDF08_06305 [Micrococcus luteus]|nr:hypothetical protein FDF08_06305 [Micrococcus luteus]
MPWEPVVRYIGLRAGSAETTAEMDLAATSLAGPDFTNVAANRVSAALARWLATGTTDLEKCIRIVLANLGLEMDDIPTGWVALEADVVVDTAGAMIVRFLYVHVVNRCFYASAYDDIRKVIARGVAVAGPAHWTGGTAPGLTWAGTSAQN